jgi:hypothetical protein
MIRIVSFLALIVVSFSLCAQGTKTENVVIVTLDGYRWREVFGGADKKILFRKKYVNDTSVQSKFWAETMNKRREKLMPFLWNVVGKEGQLYGNRRFDNGMRCTNGNLYSYSGYSEMFVGFADRRINDNDPVQNPNYTVLEALNKHGKFKNSVAAFSTWQTMTHILREDVSGIPVNSGSDKATGDELTRREKRLNKLVDHEKNPHGDRYDRFTFEYALEYMKREKPRVTFISFDETDEHGHAGRYDEYLKSAHAADKMIGVLWEWLQSQEQYKNKTTLIVTTDHGRGTSPRGWKRHALLFRGSAQIWMAVIGPDTPASGEMKSFMRLTQSQVAGTVAAMLRFPYENVKPVAPPVTSVFEQNFSPEEAAMAAGN